MAVRWKILKYKHRLKAQEMNAQITEGTLSETEMVEFVTGLVESWDFVDVETGEPLRPGDYGELSIEQFTELMTLFRTEMEDRQTEAVKKKTNSPSFSGSKPLKRAKRAATYPKRPNG